MTVNLTPTEVHVHYSYNRESKSMFKKVGVWDKTLWPDPEMFGLRKKQSSRENPGLLFPTNSLWHTVLLLLFWPTKDKRRQRQWSPTEEVWPSSWRKVNSGQTSKGYVPPRRNNVRESLWLYRRPQRRFLQTEGRGVLRRRIGSLESWSTR